MYDFQRATYEVRPRAAAFSIYWRPASTGEAQRLHVAESPADAFEWLGHEALLELDGWRVTVLHRHRGAFSPDLLDTLTGDFLTLAGACALNVIALEA